MIKKNTIPTLIGIIVLLLGTFAGIFLLKNTSIFKIGADAPGSVKNIRVSNISDSSASVSWTTDKETTDYLIWGPSAASVNKILEEDASEQKYFNHSVTLTGLEPNTVYYYKVNSEGVTVDNGGIPWQFTTGSELPAIGNSTIFSGNVISASGNPEKKALVYADIGGYLMSTVTSDTGNYVLQIASARTNDLRGYAQIDPAGTLVQISVQAFPDGVATAQIFPQSANPVPPIIIGQTYDFRSEPINNPGANPSASLSLPPDTPKQSKFDVAVPSSTTKPTSVILESINEGEVITTDKPQFFGKGPGGANITITVHSDETLTQNVQIPKNGSWSYAVPTNLSPGTHSITVSWVDVSGITRFLTRNFVVQAGEIPSFTASQSGSTATPTPTPAKTATATPIANSTPKATATPAPSPISSPTLTPAPIPETGDLTPTFLLFIMGLAVTTFSYVVWKKAES